MHIWRRETLPHVFTGYLQWCQCHEQWYDALYEKKCHRCSFSTSIEHVSYHLNRLGYRCKEFSEINHNAFKIVTMGCSETFGIGIPQSLTFGEQLATLLRHNFNIEVEIINLGAVGHSIDFVTRVLYQSLPLLQPDYVFCLLPDMSRREYIDLDKQVRFKPFIPHVSDNEALITLCTDTWAFFSMVKNVAMIELILHDTYWSWDTWMYNEWKIPEFELYFDMSHYRNQNIVDRGKAPDNMHNGVPYHTAIANDLITDPDLLTAIDQYRYPAP